MIDINVSYKESYNVTIHQNQTTEGNLVRQVSYESITHFPSIMSLFERFIEYTPLELVKDIKTRLSKAMGNTKEPKEIRLSLQFKAGFSTLDDLAVIESIPIQDDVYLFGCYF